ncbi:biopolymer transporter ExbD [Methylonatrum kenyense]|uniref:ExbD/TolR family protein n=1 Tax=Methylonatrum kenyense TaxID=455253 RepID=UPI0020BE82D6|nr:biopolymer transporter ExbD [Methylonatrum kenyense]MCK8516673.1 biopolymer transporter ExbD [Methylonatrum kenyense]
MHVEPEKRRRRHLIGLTPLIDVVFILLIFFMLASSFLDWQSISLSVPGDGRATEADLRSTVVRVLDDGQLEVDGEATSVTELRDRFSAIFADDPDHSVVVRPQDDAALQHVVRVVETLNAVGGTRVTLNRESR